MNSASMPNGPSRQLPCHVNTRLRHTVAGPFPPSVNGAILLRMDTGAAHQVPVRRRHLAVDERGIGLRATWHLERGFVNLSFWRHDRCVETFHLTPAEAARLVDFLVSGLAGAVPQPSRSLVAVAESTDEQPVRADRAPSGLSGSLAKLRRDLAATLDRAAAQLRR